MTKEYSIYRPPSQGDDDVGQFAQNCFENSMNEKIRLGLPSKFAHSYAMYRGDHWQKNKYIRKRRKNKVTVNLFFSNVNRTVSNITARKPVAEVVDLERSEDDLAKIYTAKMRKWWKDTGQQAKIKESALKNEKYGITVENPAWSKAKQEGDIIVMDCFAVFPAPGNWDNFDEGCPYFCKAHADSTDKIEQEFGLKPGTVKADEVYSTLGEYREGLRPTPSENYPGSAPATGNYADPNMSPVYGVVDFLVKRALVVELWIRDTHTMETVDVEIPLSDEEGNPIADETGNVKTTTKKARRPKYPDGIRVITFTNNGELVLSDRKNPNINWGMPVGYLRNTHAWGRFPFYKANSYIDTTSHWGFSAIDQIGDLNKKVDEIFSRLLAWVMRVMFPPLVVAKETGITKDMINSNPNLVLMPEKVAHVAGIRFVEVPNLPSNFIEILNIVLTFFDRIYQIEDADRGVGPKGIVAAAAIVALQERNAVLIQDKITAIDNLIENRGRWAMSMYQNFGRFKEPIEVDGETYYFRGADTIGRKFNYVVESGSTMPRTSLQLEEQAKDLYKEGAIDRQALLEALNFPNWKKIIERAGEGQVDQALQILIAAGLDEEYAYSLKQYVMQPNQGPGGSKTKGPGAASAGMPGHMRGKMPPAEVRQNPRVGVTA